MKWFKHMTDSHDDEKLAALLAAHGLEGYGFWWMVVALVAKQIPKDGNVPEVSYPVSTWLRLTGVYHHKKFRMFVECMNNLALISATSNQHLANIYALSTKDVLTISIPNILKFRDEYSKKSRHKKESVSNRVVFSSGSIRVLGKIEIKNKFLRASGLLILSIVKSMVSICPSLLMFTFLWIKRLSVLFSAKRNEEASGKRKPSRAISIMFQFGNPVGGCI